MMGTVVRVARGEGFGSVVTRAVERVGEEWHRRLLLARGTFAHRPRPQIVNVAAMPASTRLGGVAVQLRARLNEERRVREVALFDRGVLEIGPRGWHAESLEAIGAKKLIVEGGFADLPNIPQTAEFIVAIHDFSLISSVPHELIVDDVRRRAAERILGRARAVVFPSNFLRDAYRSVVPRFEARVVAPGIVAFAPRGVRLANRVAFAGSVKWHKGGALMPEILRATPGAQWHVFGGGDLDLLRRIRATRRAAVHGYYRAGRLPHLLARHRVGLAVLPSIVPESFSVALSECWSAGVPVVAFDRGAIADRIRAEGGGFLVAPDAGAEGIAACVSDWLRGAISAVAPAYIPTARDAASAHLALCRELGFL